MSSSIGINHHSRHNVWTLAKAMYVPRKILKVLLVKMLFIIYLFHLKFHVVSRKIILEHNTIFQTQFTLKLDLFTLIIN